ncbi:MAG TPA: DUF748 domain-containing protein [Planctomycetota bacterium]|nr:DUF748 domain-containing protein [Planctomycetota bacterium]OQC22098.1 MAG: hypothetical protein BWX69_00409 [Planctomycetes bacterium ADurb.Bin069]NMD35327.1 DUF748 domain-containing protein [Planctomycetota bacterium]HNR98019.1 DUF748 domain-containing protein [Planctomycetota bacterium]HNU25768.1 DUF748 domain-containing protein [Planctomycetota bacterium]
MKRFLPFRLAVALPVLAILAAATGLLMSSFAKTFAERGASAAFGTSVTFASLSLNPFTGTLAFTDLAVADARRPGENVFAAARGEGKLSLSELLRGRAVVDDVTLATVRMHVERNEDGSFNFEDLGEEPQAPTEEEKNAARLTDWLERLKQVAEKLKERRAQEAEKRRDERKAEKKAPPPPEQIKTGRAEYVRRIEPRVVVRRVRIEDLELELSDASKPEEKLPPLTGANAVVENLSSSPLDHDKPVTFALRGSFADQGRMNLGGTLGLQAGADALLKLDAKTESLKLALLKPLFGLSLPVALKEGVANLEAGASLTNFSALAAVPDLVLSNLDIAPDGKHATIIGIPAKDFCDAVNHAKTLAIKGLRIGGTLAAPEFSWSAEFRESLKRMLVDAGRAAAAAELDKQIAKGAEKLSKEAEKVLGSEAGKQAADKAAGVLKKAGGLIPGLGTDPK